MILAGDVGGTKILLEVGDSRSGRFESVFARRYSAEDVVNFVDVMKTFLAEWEKEKPARAKITAGALGVAGPSQGNKIRMTHRPWGVDGDAIASRCRIPRFLVVNDLAAAAAGIAALTPKETIVVQPGKALPDEPRVVLGVGTGLGVAYLVPHGGRVKVVPGEGGHIAFGPETPEQAALWRSLFEAKGRVEVEDVVSGRGLANIYEFMARQNTRAIGGHERADPAWVTQNAIEGKDPVCEAAMGLFAECLGNVAGDHALSVMARGGVYLAGGIVAKVAQALPMPRFRSGFCAKGAFASHLMRIPVRAVLSERLPVLGAARVAMEE